MMLMMYYMQIAGKISKHELKNLVEYAIAFMLMSLNEPIKQLEYGVR